MGIFDAPSWWPRNPVLRAILVLLVLAVIGQAISLIASAAGSSS